MNTSIQKEAVLSFLKAHTIATLATVSPEGTPRARTIYYASDDAFNIYFLSLASTRKVSDIRANPTAAFVVSGDDKMHTLQIEGIFVEMTDTATFGPIITELTAHLYPANGPEAPITHLDNAKPVFFKLSPTWIRWGDFLKGHGNGEVFTEIEL